MRILVSGATGFIGSHVARYLVGGGDEVVVLTRPGSDRRRIADIDRAVTWLEVNPLDAASLIAAVRSAAPEAAVLLAWYAEPGRYLEAATENLRSLAAGTLLLEGLAEGTCRRIVLAGTCLENSPPTTPYAACKTAMHAAAVGLRAAGVEVACGHVFYPYGPWEDPRRAVPSVIRALLRREPIAVGDGLERRDYLHVTDIARAMCGLVRARTVEAVDICAGSPVALREVFAQIGALIGRPDLIRYGERPSSHIDFPATGDPAELFSTGWQPKFDLRAGLLDTIDFWSTRI